MPPAANGASDRPEQHEDHPDYHQYNPESPQNLDPEQVPHHQENNAKNDHDASRQPRPDVAPLSYGTPTGFVTHSGGLSKKFPSHRPRTPSA
jgi:hypothetical protein